MNTCEFCHYETSEYLQTCQHCERPSRFPNVIAANKEDEKQVINDNYNKALFAANNKQILKDFENKVNNSNIILVRPITEVITLFDNLNNLHQTFHQRLNARATSMDDKGYDEYRPSVDAKLFPGYLDKISFAALSLNSVGATGYGGCHMLLKPCMVEYRSTIFKGNSYHLLRDTPEGQPVPKGLRSTWELRGKLAVSKLENLLNNANPDFQTILINDNDFIEVHVFGSISHRTIGEITICRSGLSKFEVLMASALKEKIHKHQKSIIGWDTKFAEV